MNFKCKSIISVICTTAILAGCGSSQKTPDAVQSPKIETETTTKETKISDKERTLSVLLTDSPTQPLLNYAKAQEAIFEKTNIKLDYQIVPSSNYDDKKSILLATNNMPDIAYVKQADVTQYAQTGIFLPLSKYIDDMPNYKAFWDKNPNMSKLMVDDELYAFQVVARDESANGFGPVIRTDLLKKHNIAIPETFDDLLDVLAKLKAEYPDSRPWTGRKGTTQLLKTTSYMLGSGYEQNGLYFDFDKKSYVYGPATQEFKAVLGYLNKAYTMGVLDPDFATTTAEQFESKLSSGKSFFFVDNSGFSSNYTKALKKIDDKAEMQVLPILENSFGQRRAIAYATELADRYYAISAKTKDPDTVIKFIDWMYSKEGSDISNYGKEGYSFEYNDKGEPEFKKDYVMKFKDASPSTYYAIYSDLGITKLNFSLWACNTRTWFEIEKIAGNWDTHSDTYWDIINNDKAYVQPDVKPPLTTEAAERVKEINLDLTTMLEQEYDKFIMGVTPIEEWDKVIARAEEIGAREIEKIYNDANANFK